MLEANEPELTVDPEGMCRRLMASTAGETEQPLSTRTGHGVDI